MEKVTKQLPRISRIGRPEAKGEIGLIGRASGNLGPNGTNRSSVLLGGKLNAAIPSDAAKIVVRARRYRSVPKIRQATGAA